MEHLRQDVARRCRVLPSRRFSLIIAIFRWRGIDAGVWRGWQPCRTATWRGDRGYSSVAWPTDGGHLPPSLRSYDACIVLRPLHFTRVATVSSVGTCHLLPITLIMLTFVIIHMGTCPGHCSLLCHWNAPHHFKSEILLMAKSSPSLVSITNTILIIHICLHNNAY